MKSYTSGKVKIEETAKMYAVTGDSREDNEIFLFTAKENAEDKLSQFKKEGHERLRVAFIREGDTLSDIHRSLL